jgi:hypothetical protein
MDGNTILSVMANLMNDGITTAAVLLLTLVAFAGTLVVWVKL